MSVRNASNEATTLVPGGKWLHPRAAATSIAAQARGAGEAPGSQYACRSVRGAISTGAVLIHIF